VASFLSFSSLIEAISRSVAQAQDEVEKHQVRNLLGYFDAKDRPRALKFRVMSRRSDARQTLEGLEEDFYSVPLLSLISINVLKIKDVDIKFSVDMGELSDERSDDKALPPDDHLPGVAMSAQQRERQMGTPTPPMKTLSVSTATGARGGKVRVKLRVTGSEPSEGAARLLDYLSQLQGVLPTLTATSESGDDNAGQSPASGDGAPPAPKRNESAP